jgi:hypothetical protein
LAAQWLEDTVGIDVPELYHPRINRFAYMRMRAAKVFLVRGTSVNGIRLRRTGLCAHNGQGAGWERREFQQQRKKFWSKRWVEESDLQALSLLCSASGLRMRNL